MKRWLSLFLLTLLLVSCSTPSASPLAPTATLIPSATAVPTLFSTATPEASPTATKDPNAPAEFTRFENGIYYLDKKTEKGNTLTYTWDKERNSWDRLIFTGYAWDISSVTTGIDPVTGKQKYPDGFMTNVYIDGAIDGEQSLPTLMHHDNNDPQNALNWSAFFSTDLFEQMANKGLIKDSNSFDFGTFWFSHDYHIDFTNADRPQRFNIDGGSTMTIHIRNDAEKLKADMTTNGFSEVKSTKHYGPENGYMVKIWAIDGSLFVDIAPTLRPATEWTQKQIMEMVMFGFSAVMEQGPDLTHPYSGSLLSEFALNQDKFKLIDYGPSQ